MKAGDETSTGRQRGGEAEELESQQAKEVVKEEGKIEKKERIYPFNATAFSASLT